MLNKASFLTLLESNAPFIVLLTLVAGYLITFVFRIIIDEPSIPGFPLHGKEKNEVGNLRAKQRYFSSPRKLIMEGLNKAFAPLSRHFGISVPSAFKNSRKCG